MELSACVRNTGRDGDRVLLDVLRANPERIHTLREFEARFFDDPANAACPGRADMGVCPQTYTNVGVTCTRFATVKPSYGLADDQIAQMLKDGFAHAEADMAARSLREAQVEAERMVLATRAALAADSALLTEAERADVEVLITATLAAAQGADAGAVEAAVKTLAEGTEAFAALRMNQGIRQALAGRRIEDV